MEMFWQRERHGYRLIKCLPVGVVMICLFGFILIHDSLHGVGVAEGFQHLEKFLAGNGVLTELL